MATQSFFFFGGAACQELRIHWLSVTAPLIEWAGQLNFKFEAKRLKSPS